ncbi:MAG TPA: hypothetical protein PK514_14750 [Spirochaetota bacterium]|nr:hypothetical protein [Spirochaetota bacterium]
MNSKWLPRIIILSTLIPALYSCTESVITEVKNENVHEYINSTGNLKQSGDRLEEAPAYEVYFTLDRTIECISVSLETANVPERFTDESIPQKSFFVIEKLMDIRNGADKTQKAYIQIGKNYNSRWEVHNPLKICGNTGDQVSRLGGSVFRIRFTTFDTRPVYFTVTVYTEAGVNFGTDPAILLQGNVQVK